MKNDAQRTAQNGVPASPDSFVPGVVTGALLSHRPLTREEASLLHEELKTTPNIFGYTVQELMRFSDVLVTEVEGSLAGACISKDLAFGWTDIAMLYVLPAFRGRGIGRELYTAAWDRAAQRDRHILTLSRSPEVIHLMERAGMALSRSVWKAPLALHLHMNRHMCSLYRIQEMRRKAKLWEGTSSRLLMGTRRASRSRRGASPSGDGVSQERP